jgi:hypothetical protein
LSDIRQKLEELDRVQLEESERASSAYQNTETLQEELMQLDNAAQALQSQIEILKEEKKDVEAERQDVR